MKKIKENKDLIEYSNSNKNDIRDDDITFTLFLTNIEYRNNRIHLGGFPFEKDIHKF